MLNKIIDRKKKKTIVRINLSTPDDADHFITALKLRVHTELLGLESSMSGEGEGTSGCVSTGLHGHHWVDKQHDHKVKIHFVKYGTFYRAAF